MLWEEFNENIKCKYGRVFRNIDDDVKQVSQNMKIFYGYNTNGNFLHIPVFSLLTMGNMCACTQQVDTTDIFLWNLSYGQFIDFKVLFDLLDKWSEVVYSQPFEQNINITRICSLVRINLAQIYYEYFGCSFEH